MTKPQVDVSRNFRLVMGYSFHLSRWPALKLLFHHHPCRLQQRIGDQPDHRGRGDQERSRADHADRNRDEELSLIEPTILLNESLLEKRDDNEAAAEGQRTRFQEEQEKLTKRRTGRDRRCRNHNWQGRGRALED